MERREWSPEAGVSRIDEQGVRSLFLVGNEADVAGGDTDHHYAQDTCVATISRLMDAVNAKDAYTQGHCERVSRYALRAAQALGLSSDETRIACYAALLHDVGKIGLSDRVLNKPGPLTEEERALVQTHTQIGYELLMALPTLREIAPAVLHHHEWYDGHGYPMGLSGEDIPIASRIVSAIDAYCAMIDERSYKQAFSPVYAREELLRCAGTQFDPRVVAAVLVAIDAVDGVANSRGIAASCAYLPRLRITTSQR